MASTTVKRESGGWKSSLDVTVVLLAALTTAAAGLVIEDAIPLNPSDRVFDLVRWLVLVASGGALAAAVRTRRRRISDVGTLYYVRFLAEWMADWRQVDLQKGKRRHLDQRVLTKWATERPTVGIVDWTDSLRELGRDLQAEMNTDSADTAFHLAPNMLLPSAVALGYEIYGWDHLRLMELFPGDEPLVWSLEQAAAPAPYDMPTIRSAADPMGPREDVELAECWGCPRDGVQGGAGAVLVTVDLTGKGATTLPAGRYHHRYRVAVFADPARDIEVSGENRPVTVTTTLPPLRGHGRAADGHPLAATVHPVDATSQTVRAIRLALHEHPSSLVVVAARVPKTVALAIGWQLANLPTRDDPGCGTKGGCRRTACLHPWRHLVIAQLNQEVANGGYFMTRVHPAQPTADEIRFRVGFGQ